MDQIRNNLERSRRRTMFAAVLIAATLVVGILIGTVINGKVSAMKTFSFGRTRSHPLLEHVFRNCESRGTRGGEHRHDASDRSPEEAPLRPG